jgi:putative DNA primase/helicase
VAKPKMDWGLSHYAGDLDARPIGYKCRSCDLPLQQTHVDDAGTHWFKCPKCADCYSLSGSEYVEVPTSEEREQSKKELIERLTAEKKEQPATLENIVSRLPPVLLRRDWNDNEEPFNPVHFAEDLMRILTFKTTRDNETVYVYEPQEGIYTPLGVLWIKAAMAVSLRDHNKNRHLADIIHHIQGSTYIDRPASPKDKIGVSNGTLNVLTGELGKPSPDDWITVKLPVTFDSKADCPAIKKFIIEVAGEEQALTIQEFIGYCLFQATPIHKALMLVGEGANGKSTLLSLIQAFLGSANVSDVSLQALCYNRFAAAHLYGKLANFYADLPDKALLVTGMFKMLTGGDSILAEEKFKQGFSFVNTAKLAFSCNKPPDANDDTLAFWRRWVLLAFNKTFTGDKDDKKLLGKLTTPEELSGFLNYALAGLKRLLEHGTFSQKEDLDNIRTDYIRKSNSAKAFIEERLDYDPSPDVFVSQQDLYQKYCFYCAKQRLPSVAKATLTKNMSQFMPSSALTQRRIGEAGERRSVWTNIKEREPAVSAVSTVSSANSLMKHSSQILKEGIDSPDSRDSADSRADELVYEGGS